MANYWKTTIVQDQGAEPVTIGGVTMTIREAKNLGLLEYVVTSENAIRGYRFTERGMQYVQGRMPGPCGA